jgi:hypothetical protein
VVIVEALRITWSGRASVQKTSRSIFLMCQADRMVVQEGLSPLPPCAVSVRCQAPCLAAFFLDKYSGTSFCSSCNVVCEGRPSLKLLSASQPRIQ